MDNENIAGIKRQLIFEQQEAIENIRLLKEFQAYPELPIVITRIGIPQAVSAPLSERANLIHFLMVCWERELIRTTHFIEKMKLEEKRNGAAEG